ncbi:Protein GVQW3 [Anthophora retusa]
MSSPIENCTAEEQRAVIRFLVAEGVNGSEIHARMLKVYGNKCLHRSNTYKWVEQFKNGRESVDDAQRSGRPVQVSTSSLEFRIDEIIRDNRRTTVEMIAGKVSTSVGTVHNIIHNKLQYKKTCARWVPRQRHRQLKNAFENWTGKFFHTLLIVQILPLQIFTCLVPLRRLYVTKNSAPTKKSRFRILIELNRTPFDLIEERWDKCISVGVDYVEK